MGYKSKSSITRLANLKLHPMCTYIFFDFHTNHISIMALLARQPLCCNLIVNGASGGSMWHCKHVYVSIKGQTLLLCHAEPRTVAFSSQQPEDVT